MNPDTPSCPICRKPSDARYRPFCSRRCADVDLGRWFAEGYAIQADRSVAETPKEEEASE